MTDRPDRARRKALLRDFKARERAAAEARLPLSKTDLAALLDRLDRQLEEGEACERTLRLTEAFLRERGLDVAVVGAWLRESGGYCDCEVLANVGNEWDDRL